MGEGYPYVCGCPKPPNTLYSTYIGYTDIGSNTHPTPLIYTVGIDKGCGVYLPSTYLYTLYRGIEGMGYPWMAGIHNTHSCPYT